MNKIKNMMMDLSAFAGIVLLALFSAFIINDWDNTCFSVQFHRQTPTTSFFIQDNHAISIDTLIWNTGLIRIAPIH